MKMRTISGIIEAISDKGNKYGVKLEGGDAWYNGFGRCGFNRGDNVTITFNVDGMWNRIKTIRLDKGLISENRTSDDKNIYNAKKETAIRKAVALKEAIHYLEMAKFDVTDLGRGIEVSIETAQKFEKYLDVEQENEKK